MEKRKEISNIKFRTLVTYKLVAYEGRMENEIPGAMP